MQKEDYSSASDTDDEDFLPSPEHSSDEDNQDPHSGDEEVKEVKEGADAAGKKKEGKARKPKEQDPDSKEPQRFASPTPPPPPALHYATPHLTPHLILLD